MGPEARPRRRRPDGAARALTAPVPAAGKTQETMKAGNRTGRTLYRSAVGIALATALILGWVAAGVGVIGADGDPSNMMYVGVVAVGVIGSIVVRFRPQGMSRALFATALAQMVVTVIALVAGLGLPASPPMELLLVNGFFVVMWVGSGWLFRASASGQ